jgi:DNA-binding CsgD family transcriptional regulator
MTEVEKARLPVNPVGRSPVDFAMLSGIEPAALSIADFLEMQGLCYDPTAEITLLLDIPRGFALHCLERTQLSLDSLIVVTWNDCPEYVEDLWEMQPAVLLVASELGEAIPQALMRVAQGERYRTSTSRTTMLTPVERRILRLLARGYMNQDIAEQLKMQLQTVKNVLANTYQKLGLRNRSEALLYYWGILSAFECDPTAIIGHYSNKIFS